MDPVKKACLKALFEESQLHYTRYFFKHLEGNKLIVSPHHKIMCDTFDRVLNGEIKRLIVNVPPGYTKTQIAVINFISRGLAVNPSSKFIHTSYSDDLVKENSKMIRDIVKCEEFQEFWPINVRKDSDSKKAWYTEEGGGLLAIPSGGAITGFRAGRINDGFSGAFISDDPLKPEDAYSVTKRERINNRINNTFKSRLALESKTPMIFIMQRLHEDDCTGFLLRGGTGEKWHHLNLPVEISEESKRYPSSYTHGIPINYDLKDGPLWPLKHNEEHIEVLRTSDPYTFASQYMQNPKPLGGGIFKDCWWKYYDVPPTFEYRFITGDTAQKTKEHNDFSVFQCWGVIGNDIYLIDQIRGKWEAPELKVRFVSFWNKHNSSGAQTVSRLRSAYIEDKASGTGLIQEIQRNEGIPIRAIQRNIDKITRALDNVGYIASGHVFLPENAHFLSDYIEEFSSFTPKMSHKHDDQIDPTLDAIEIGLVDHGDEIISMTF